MAIKQKTLDHVASYGLRYHSLMFGELTPVDMDDEEVARCKLRLDDGTFEGPHPLLPPSFVEAIRRENIGRATRKWELQLHVAIDTMYSLMVNPMSDEATRFRAAAYIIERVTGKIPDKVAIAAVVKRWESAVEDVIVGTEAEWEELETIASYPGREGEANA